MWQMAPFLGGPWLPPASPGLLSSPSSTSLSEAYPSCAPAPTFRCSFKGCELSSHRVPGTALSTEQPPAAVHGKRDDKCKMSYSV